MLSKPVFFNKFSQEYKGHKFDIEIPYGFIMVCKSKFDKSILYKALKEYKSRDNNFFFLGIDNISEKRKISGLVHKVIVIDASHGVLGMGDRMSISFDISNQYIIFASNERNPLYSENLFNLVEENGIVRLKYKKKGH